MHWALIVLVWTVLFVWLVIVGICDLRTRRIPNWLLVLGVVLGLAIRGGFGGVHPLSGAILGLVFGLLLGLVGERIPLVIGRWAMGDAKCLAVIGVYLGWLGVLFTVFVAAGIFACLRVVLLTRHSGAPQRSFAFGPILGIGAVVTMTCELGALLWLHG